MAPSAHAASFAVGARIECDATQNHTYYRPGVVIAFQPGDAFNGNAPSSGYFYRVRLDGGDPAGTLCRAEDMRPAAAPPAAQPALTAAPAKAPATAPARAPTPAPVVRPTPAAPPVKAPQAAITGKRTPEACPTQTKATGGAPPLALGKTLVKCLWEGLSSNLHTINFDWESASLGAPRSWKETWAGRDMGTGVPGSTLVYPITGQWVVRTYSSSGLVTVEYKGTHNCYINAAREWQCGMGDSTELKRSEVAAP